jgi:hypothetical protein
MNIITSKKNERVRNTIYKRLIILLINFNIIIIQYFTR